MLYDSPTAGLDPVTAYRIIALVIQNRDTRNSTSIVVTHRHQDGKLLANFDYDPATAKLKRASDGRLHARFILLREDGSY
jgi:phospholipid/cholesterol/gamma-HCH transport system ATP-binding protein